MALQVLELQETQTLMPGRFTECETGHKAIMHTGIPYLICKEGKQNLV